MFLQRGQVGLVLDRCAVLDELQRRLRILCDAGGGGRLRPLGEQPRWRLLGEVDLAGAREVESFVELEQRLLGVLPSDQRLGVGVGVGGGELDDRPLRIGLDLELGDVDREPLFLAHRWPAGQVLLAEQQHARLHRHVAVELREVDHLLAQRGRRRALAHDDARRSLLDLDDGLFAGLARGEVVPAQDLLGLGIASHLAGDAWSGSR